MADKQTTGPCIDMQGLTKRYKVHRRLPGLRQSLRSLFHREYITIDAVVELDLKIGQGEAVALVGENGAGKTTLMKMLAGILYPSGGEVRVYGADPSKREHNFLRRIAFLSGQKAQLAWDLSPADSYQLFRALYDIPLDRFRRNLDELTEKLDLGDVLGVQSRRLSLGQRMKCEIAGALLHDPTLLLLDEPTIGLDFDMQEIIRRFLKSYVAERRATLLMTSHYMADVEAVADRLLLLQGGRFIYDGGLRAFVASHARSRSIVATLQNPARDREAVERIAASRQKAEINWTSEHVAELSVLSDDMPNAVRELTSSIDLEDLDVRQPSLESIIAHFRAGLGAER